MKANRGSVRFLVVAAAVAALVAGCSERRVIPPPAPAPTPRPVAPPPAPPVARDWRQAPITPGDWSWGMEGRQSIARFAGGALVLRCDPATRTVTLERAAHLRAPGFAATGTEPMTITTTSGARTLSASRQPDGLAVTLPARDPVLDAMAFSRGRFAVEARGLAPLYVPSWPEVARVTDDCRDAT